jgi:hypothetical protein
VPGLAFRGTAAGGFGAVPNTIQALAATDIHTAGAVVRTISVPIPALSVG